MHDFSAVLCVGQEARLLDIRSAVLRTRFATVMQSSIPDLRRTLAQCPFHLMVLCHTLSEVECAEAGRLFLASNPDAAIVAMYTNHTAFYPTAADACVPSLAGPERMFHAVESLQYRGQPRFARLQVS